MEELNLVVSTLRITSDNSARHDTSVKGQIDETSSEVAVKKIQALNWFHNQIANEADTNQPYNFYMPKLGVIHHGLDDTGRMVLLNKILS